MNTSYTKTEIALQKKLSKAANEEGTIQASAMHRLAPHHRPELHATMSVAAAFRALTGKAFDAEFFCR